MEFWIKVKYFILFLEIALILYLDLISLMCKEKIFFVMEVKSFLTVCVLKTFIIFSFLSIGNLLVN